jgi:hypothetical protein
MVEVSVRSICIEELELLSQMSEPGLAVDVRLVMDAMRQDLAPDLIPCCRVLRALLEDRYRRRTHRRPDGTVRTLPEAASRARSGPTPKPKPSSKPSPKPKTRSTPKSTPEPGRKKNRAEVWRPPPVQAAPPSAEPVEPAPSPYRELVERTINQDLLNSIYEESLKRR